jgi:hypothetical protein
MESRGIPPGSLGETAAARAAGIPPAVAGIVDIHKWEDKPEASHIQPARTKSLVAQWAKEEPQMSDHMRLDRIRHIHPEHIRPVHRRPGHIRPGYMRPVRNPNIAWRCNPPELVR